MPKHIKGPFHGLITEERQSYDQKSTTRAHKEAQRSATSYKGKCLTDTCNSSQVSFNFCSTHCFKAEQYCSNSVLNSVKSLFSSLAIKKKT